MDKPFLSLEFLIYELDMGVMLSFHGATLILKVLYMVGQNKNLVPELVIQLDEGQVRGLLKGLVDLILFIGLFLVLLEFFFIPLLFFVVHPDDVEKGPVIRGDITRVFGHSLQYGSPYSQSSLSC